ncbi:hypothetical protein [Streptomyces chrestomyceticus]|uniref:hypothetical protein n=1 Tax=Streptomyces chrestomyceticus TaxID=68185 RepID=UPI003795D7F3
MNVKDAVVRETVLRALLDVIGTAYQQARAEAQQLLDAAAQDHGLRQVAAALPDGRQVAVVSLTGGTAEAHVTDERAFTRWVAADYPTEDTLWAASSCVPQRIPSSSRKEEASLAARVPMSA